MFEARMSGDQELVAEFGGMPERIFAGIRRRIAALAIELQAHVKGQKLSGQVLKNRTGNLRQSVGFQVDEADGTIVARVGVFQGPTVIYGRAHEWGVTKAVPVKAHLRTVKDRFESWKEDRIQIVRAHTRNMKLPERSFLRSALADKREAIVTGLNEELAALLGV